MSNASHRECWIAVRDHHTGDDASQITSSALSSFTAVNQQPLQTPTPYSSFDAPILQNEGRRRAHGPTKRTRNPTVAQYLGLGTECEPMHLEKYAPVSDVPKLSASQPARKRRRKLAQGNQVSQSIQTVTQLAAIANQPALTDTNNTTKAPNNCKIKGTATDLDTRQTLTPTNSHDDVPHVLQNWTPDDDDIDDEVFNSDLADEDFLALSMDTLDHLGTSSKCSSNLTSPIRTDALTEVQFSKENRCPQQELPASTNNTTKKFISPVTLTTQLLSSAVKQSTEVQKPIVRPPFPHEVRDRSPIIGLSSNAVLRTCFRIGEALNQAHHASKTNRNMLFELYARVLESHRDNMQQSFTLCDLFHTRVPYLKAGYSRNDWKSVPLFEYDSKRLLLPGRLCRCIGRIVRQRGDEWSMTVLNIWEATWDDIEWVAGAVSS